MDANVEYIGHIEEILELNYRRHCVVVLVCDFVKANYVGENATIKKDKWGFTIANYSRRPSIVCQDLFAFPRHCEQVFYSEATELPGWRVVLRKEVRGKRVLPGEEDKAEQFIFAMGEDENFEGLRPEREVGEQPHPGVSTCQNVMLQEVLVPSRQTAGGGRGRARNHALGRGALRCRVRRVRMNGRGRGRGAEAAARAEPASKVGSSDYDEDDWNEVDELYSQNLAPEGESRHRRRAQSDANSGEQGRHRRINGEGQSGIALESTFSGNNVGESRRDSMSSNSGSSGSA